MKKTLFALFLTTALIAEDKFYLQEGLITKRAEAVAENPYNKITTSMVGWGVGLAIGIALVCALVKNSKAI